MTSPGWYWFDVFKCFNGIDNQRNEDGVLESPIIIHALKWHFFTSFRKSRQAEKDTFPISHSGGSQRRY